MHGFECDNQPCDSKAKLSLNLVFFIWVETTCQDEKLYKQHIPQSPSFSLAQASEWVTDGVNKLKLLLNKAFRVSSVGRELVCRVTCTALIP